jgi:hypothetical protein
VYARLGTFQSTNRQALEAIKKLQKDGKIKSVGTNRNYLEALKHIAKHTTGNLRDLLIKFYCIIKYLSQIQK